jgi:hypothetical protein
MDKHNQRRKSMPTKVSDEVKKFLSAIGRKGGQTSRRTLSTEQAKAMVEAREKKRKKRAKKK